MRAALKNLRTLFGASLLLNVLLLAVLGGWAIMSWHSYSDRGLFLEAEGISPETRNIAARSFQAARRDMHETLKDVKSAQGDLERVVSNEKFDSEKFDEASRRLIAARQKVSVRRMEVFRDMASTLPLEERKILGAHIIHAPGGRETPPQE